MAKNKSVQPIAVNQANNTRQKIHPDIEPHKWKPGQSGNPDGRPLRGLAQVSLDKELGDQPCPEKIWKAIERQMPGCFPKEWLPPTWLQAEVVKNRIRAMSLPGAMRWRSLVGRWPMENCGFKSAVRRTGRFNSNRFDLKKLTTEELRQWRELAVKAAIQQE